MLELGVSSTRTCSPRRAGRTPRRRPVEPGDPGRFHALFGRDSLITSLQVLPERPDVARATLRALARAAGARGAPGHARGAGQDRPRVPRRARPRGSWPAAGPTRAGSATTAPPTRRRGSSCCCAGRRRAGGRAGAGLARGGGVAATRALERGGGLVRHAPGEWGALTQQGWRDAIDARAAGPGLGDPAARRRAARSGRWPTSTPRPSPTPRCGRSARCRATPRWERLAGGLRERLGALGPGGAGGRRRTATWCRARAPSSAGCCGRTRSTARRARRPRSGCASPTC